MLSPINMNALKPKNTNVFEPKKNMMLLDLKIDTTYDDDFFRNSIQEVQNALREEQRGDFEEPALVELTEDDIFTEEVRNETFIAAGGFGSVSSVEYGEDNTCVVKTIDGNDGLAEAAKLKEVGGIVPAFLGYEEEANTVKIYMEKCTGSVEDLIQSGYFEGNLEAKLDMIQQVFTLILNLKETNFAHCDLKAANIGYIENEDEKVYKLLDFGSACKLNEDGRGFPGLTTMDFKAPEFVAEDGAIHNGHKLDIYAIGGMIFNLETGEMPMDSVREKNRGRTEDIIADRIEMQLSEYYFKNTCHIIPDKIPVILKNIIRECWVANPTDRKTAEQMLQCYFN